jgi:hypothetical protein
MLYYLSSICFLISFFCSIVPPLGAKIVYKPLQKVLAIGVVFISSSTIRLTSPIKAYKITGASIPEV